LARNRRDHQDLVAVCIETNSHSLWLPWQQLAHRSPKLLCTVLLTLLLAQLTRKLAALACPLLPLQRQVPSNRFQRSE
jgi:hypothetical protein